MSNRHIPEHTAEVDFFNLGDSGPPRSEGRGSDYASVHPRRGWAVCCGTRRRGSGSSSSSGVPRLKDLRGDVIQPELRSGLFGWRQLTAAALSGVLIISAIAVVFLAAFIQVSLPAPTPRLSLSTTSAQRAPQLPICHPTRAHLCGRRAGSASAKPTPASDQGQAK